MESTSKKPSVWPAIRKHLSTLDQTELLGLCKDHYDLAEVNRGFLQARCLGQASGSEALEIYRKKIVEQFFPGGKKDPKLKLGEARKAIREYRKATGSIAGTAELLMCYVENGVAFTNKYGDIDERFYNSIESALGELDALLRKEKGLYPDFVERLDKLERDTDGIGWGFHDYIAQVVRFLERDLGDS